MKTTIENLEFPCDFKERLKRKVSFKNLSINYIQGHIIKINKTNLCITEPHKIIAKNNTLTLVAYLYDNTDNIYLPNSNAIITFTKFINILNNMNKND